MRSNNIIKEAIAFLLFFLSNPKGFTCNKYIKGKDKKESFIFRSNGGFSFCQSRSEKGNRRW